MENPTNANNGNSQTQANNNPTPGPSNPGSGSSTNPPDDTGTGSHQGTLPPNPQAGSEGIRPTFTEPEPPTPVQRLAAEYTYENALREYDPTETQPQIAEFYEYRDSDFQKFGRL